MKPSELFPLLFVAISICQGNMLHLRAAEGEQQLEDRIANLSDQQKTQLSENIKKLRDLKPAEQTHLIKLQERIEAHPESATLHAIMENFHAWFEKLPESDRMHFRKLVKDDERIAFIREMQNQQRRKKPENFALKLSPKDEEAIFAWVTAFALKHKTRLMNSLPPDQSRKLENIGDDNKRTLAFTCMMFMKRMGAPGLNALRPSKEDFEKLKPTLSADAIKLLDQQPDEQRRMYLVHNWVLTVLWKRAVPEATPSKLEDFAQKLPQNRREQLDYLPSPEDRERELRTMYIMASLIGFRPGEWLEHGDEPPHFFGPGGKGGEPRGKGFGEILRPFLEPPPGKK